MAEQETRKQFLQNQLSQLITARSSYDSHWKELSDFILPIFWTSFRGVPVRTCDALLSTESQVS